MYVFSVMPKIKRGRHHYHYVSKNSERKWQSRPKLQTITNTILGSDNQFDSLKQDVSMLQLPRWHKFVSGDTILLSLVSNSPSKPSVVYIVLTVYKHLKWDVNVYGKPVPSNSNFVSDFQQALKPEKKSKIFAQVYKELRYVKGIVNNVLLSC